jgi:hypothetical protein
MWLPQFMCYIQGGQVHSKEAPWSPQNLRFIAK